jgi:hypothetical protein
MVDIKSEVMKYIIASIFSLGIFSAGIAQDNPYENSVGVPGGDSITINQPVIIDVFVRDDENKEPGQTEFGKTCTMKRQENQDQADLGSARAFKMKDKDLKVEKKENGEERVKFDNEVEGLVYHKTKKGKVHYKYNYYKDRNENFSYRQKKNGKGYGKFKTGSMEDANNVLMKQRMLGIENDVNSCMR